MDHAGNHRVGPFEVYHDGRLDHLVGILRSQLSVPHDDKEGDTAGEGRRAMGWSISSIQYK
eukprot:2517188-Prorocentrum_lima.AAC.1